MRQTILIVALQTGQAIDAAKAHSSVKAWALLLNDAIERAMTFTAEYYGIPATIETEVSTDFSVEPYARAPLEALAGARATKAISLQAYLEGLKRFDVLTADFDIDADRVLLQAEMVDPQVTVEETVQIREKSKAMLDTSPPGVNHTPKGIRASLKRQIQAGDELAFSVLDDDGIKRASQTLRFDRCRYRIRSAETGEKIEDGFATMAAAERAGFAASREKLGHIL